MSGATHLLPADDPGARAERLVVDRALDTTLGEYPVDRLVDGIREARIALGLTQAKVARLAGLSAGMVWRLENAQARNSWGAIVRLRTALTLLELGGPVDDLMLVAGRANRTISDALVQPACAERGEVRS